MDSAPLTAITKTAPRWLNSFPVLGQLHLLVAMLTFLIFLDFLALFFTLDMLSAVRVFERSERLWSRGITHAVHHLKNYAHSENAADYQQFLVYLKTPLGYAKAQQELDKRVLNQELATKAFLEQGNHPDDARKIIRYYRLFREDPYIKTATNLWREGNGVIFRLFEIGTRLYGRHAASNPAKAATKGNDIDEIDTLSTRLMALENRFSQTLGEGALRLERILTWFLASVVFSGFLAALALTLSIRKTLSRGLRELAAAARQIGEGEFGINLRLPADEEFGVTAEALLAASHNLARNISRRERAEQALRETNDALESKVRERTSEMAKANQLATEAIQARDEFISTASHELKTPLTCLKLQLALTAKTISRETAPHALYGKFETALTMCQQQVEKLAELAGQLLDVSQIRAGKMNLEPRRGELNRLVEAVVRRMSSEIAATRCKIALDLQNGIFGVWDQPKIEQVLVNLLSNAFKYAPGSIVCIKSRIDGDKAELTVRDHGPGIAEEYQQRIFDRFDRAGERPGGGLGLGLYIAKRIVEAHGGRIGINSTPGQGAAFTVQLSLYSPTLKA